MGKRFHLWNIPEEKSIISYLSHSYVSPRRGLNGLPVLMAVVLAKKTKHFELKRLQGSDQIEDFQLFKGTVRPDWIFTRVEPLDRHRKGYQPL
jgi:hypothetical protein